MRKYGNAIIQGGASAVLGMYRISNDLSLIMLHQGFLYVCPSVTFLRLGVVVSNGVIIKKIDRICCHLPIFSTAALAVVQNFSEKKCLS